MSPLPSIISGITPARWPEDDATVRMLFRDYADGLGVDLSFQGFEAELASLPGRYAPPQGTILLARAGADGRAALGCVALRPTRQPGICEMKRLYVHPSGRGQRLGRRLAEAAIAAARGLTYRRMLLDTLDFMHEARRLYASLGFRPVPPYYDNPLPGVVYLALDR